jgi:hypothetical protein
LVGNLAARDLGCCALDNSLASIEIARGPRVRGRASDVRFCELVFVSGRPDFGLASRKLTSYGQRCYHLDDVTTRKIHHI